ncbi:Ephrin-B2 EPH-related receptor tyrosine kinase ligand 5 [Collichthys lucidus]|uniref:Ephrin-B2 EPH-related receptor tyrosine kinase ligand 5 n=1 Tax=Collichthys lucidus TaxID=240159 RepID=A0A4U5U7M0_COLLU|nr:Ephrin-B2 EPH-related receptor tyrosine kinase ligand 5 [Collichthys lucidus]
MILLAVISSCRAVTLESILWSSSNAKFTPGQGLVLYPQIGDKMDIVCPRADAFSGEREEFYRVYLVSRSQMESCTIDKTDTPLLNCDKPHRAVKFTFKFQEFSPNLWGLEFLKGRDYYITSTSAGSLQGLDNTDGGVCRTKSMKLVLRVGQNTGSETGQTNPSGSSGPEPGLFMWVLSGCVILLLVIIILLVVLWRYRRHNCVPDSQQSASVSLNTLAVPKRDSISSDNNSSDRSDAVFPLRASDSMACRHYERVSSDYGPPVYIVQEITPQSPTNIYYKV